jgi:hypothetical protein
MGNERSSRGLWIFRGLLGLFAVGLMVLVVVQRSASPNADADWLKLTERRGSTAQGNVIAVRSDRLGHPVGLDTYVRARCANGTAWAARWSSFDGTAVPFRRDRRGLRVVQISDRTYDNGTFGQNVFSMRATLGPGAGQARGWVRLTVAFSRANGWSTACDSGRVPFAIGAPLAPTPATSARPS